MRRLSSPCFVLWTVTASFASVQAFTAGNGILLSSRHQQQQQQYQHTTTDTASPPSALSVVSSQEVDTTTATEESPASASAGTGTDAADLLPLTMDVISKLRFRELHRELNSRHLSTTGTTSQLRDRLRQAAQVVPECIVNEDGIEDDCEPVVSIVSKQ
jgi:hypothetical protein